MLFCLNTEELRAAIVRGPRGGPLASGPTELLPPTSPRRLKPQAAPAKVEVSHGVDAVCGPGWLWVAVVARRCGHAPPHTTPPLPAHDPKHSDTDKGKSGWGPGRVSQTTRKNLTPPSAWSWLGVGPPRHPTATLHPAPPGASRPKNNNAPLNQSNFSRGHCRWPGRPGRGRGAGRPGPLRGRAARPREKERPAPATAGKGRARGSRPRIRGSADLLEKLGGSDPDHSVFNF